MRLDARARRATSPIPRFATCSARACGLNLGLDYLPGTHHVRPASRGRRPTPRPPRGLVWLDALVINVDRTAKNPNLLIWHAQLWLIDHGAALYFHHS